MRTALAYEWWRLRTLRSTWWTAAATLMVTALLALAFGALIKDMSADRGQAVPVSELLVIMLTKSPLTPVTAGALGVFAMGHEYRYGTIRTTLALTPRRSVAFGAKAVSIAAFSAVLALANLAVAWAVALPVLAGESLSGVPAALLVRVHIGHVLLVAGWGLAGVALGALIRSQTVALLTLLAVPFVVEPMLRAVLANSGQSLLERVAMFLPFTAGSAMTGAADAGSALLDSGAQLGPLAGGVVFLALITAKTAAAATAFRRRDA
ncbi:ABC transporter permease [Streptomyces sp. FIT100]|uniref:ABC transporter permease n=1 Tax=Streptomyces sp. FIT100 TaxID=2837956 RepID=UPI0021C962A8|nr:ABC transporter permease [Streptomyces sp. FIT100]UUN27770.1 ABC transporter permease [Streptomyces sp. FIT100]